MKNFLILLLFVPVFAFADAMYSPTWGFFIDLPEGYEYVDGDARDRFSFAGPEGLMFDLVVYNGTYNSMPELINDVNRRLNNRGDFDFFQYSGRQAALLKLTFGSFDGWGLVLELDSPDGNSRQRPMLLALAYAPANGIDFSIFHLSALDSICPSFVERYYPGPIMEYDFPRGEPRLTSLALNGLNAIIRENDAEAAQVLIEREFSILQAYMYSPYLQDATIRYYRSIFRDSYDRIMNPVSVIIHNFGGFFVFTDDQKRTFAQSILTFIQGFTYERDLSGSDFLNLVTVITEGRGDCDSRAMLFAIILSNANIRSAMMISYSFSHAMGLADLTGYGARFESYGTNWLVAETTDFVDIGLIALEQSDPRYWFSIIFE